MKNADKPSLKLSASESSDVLIIKMSEEKRGEYKLFCADTDDILFTENDTNFHNLYDTENKSKFVKDGINNFIVHNKEDAVNEDKSGTKAAAHYKFEIEAGESRTIYMRLTKQNLSSGNRKTLNAKSFVSECDEVFEKRIAEADEFYSEIVPANLSSDAKNVMRQSLSGMLWSKQFYHYVVKNWLEGDEAFPPPPKDA